MAAQSGVLTQRNGFPGRVASIWRGSRRLPIVPMAILLILVIGAIFAPVLSPHHPIRGELTARLDPPFWLEGGSLSHPLGTDQYGRDVYTRILHGARVSLPIAFSAVAMGLVLGTVLGLTAGLIGGQVDEAIMRLVDLTAALPFLLVAMVIVMVFGQSFMVLLLALALFAWPGVSRQVRGEVLQLREMDYVSLARVAGAGKLRIMFRHLLPGVINTVIVVTTLRTGQTIIAESTLSFLGVGLPAPDPAWGLMVSTGRDYLASAWWIALWPGVAIGLTVMSLNFLGDWFRDFSDPRLRQLS